MNMYLNGNDHYDGMKHVLLQIEFCLKILVFEINLAMKLWMDPWELKHLSQRIMNIWWHNGPTQMNYESRATRTNALWNMDQWIHQETLVNGL